MRSIPFRLLLLSCILAAYSVIAAGQQPVQVAQTITPERESTGTKAAGPLTRPADLTRVGVQQAQTLPLSLQEAIRRALESNNDIEVSRGDVRFQETQVRSLIGVYDPVFTANPT